MNSSDGSGQTNLSNNLSANDTSPDWEAVGFVVSATDFVFTLATAKPALGSSVLWNFDGPSDHTATDSTAMGLFDSGLMPPGTSFVFPFTAAGQYPYVCSIHAVMTGNVKVPVVAAPKTGGVTTTFTITWATAGITGYVFDIQIKRPGSTIFENWRTGKVTLSSTFVPDAGVGTYQFQARIRKTGNGATSNYSAPVTITVS